MIVKELTIDEFINTRYRDYAIYTLESRGIPSFYDSLTNVQRIILLNTPNKVTPTLSVIGDCFKDGYHHGDQSLTKSINRMTKKYNCSYSILNGYGFFGNMIGTEQAAPRYTSIKINNKIYEILNKFKYLNVKNSHNNYDELFLDVPIGLLTFILGISVGYQSKILPRKFEDIVNFLNGKKTALKPFFNEFTGKITNYNGLKNVWLLESIVDVDEKNHTLHIKNLVPLLKYDTLLSKLNHILEDCNFKIENKSKDNVDIKLKINENWDFLKEKIINYTKLIVKENIVFIKDGKVLEYDCIENYLIDFKNNIKNVNLKNIQYILTERMKDLEFNLIKKDFYDFIFEKKRKDNEIQEYINKYSIDIKNKIDNIKLVKLNKDEYLENEEKINSLKTLIIETKKQISFLKKDIEQTDFSLNNNKNKLLTLIEDENINSDIEVFIDYEDE